MLAVHFPDELSRRIQQAAVIAVLVVDRLEHAVPLARALLKGGINAMELTLRTPVAVDALSAIVDRVPQMLPGVGTVLTTQQVGQVARAGAAFGVAPGLNRRVVDAARNADLPFAPGVVTPSELELALDLGCRHVKFFPAEPSGGLRYLESMAAPYAHLGVRFIPLGGINLTNLPRYLESPLVTAVGGSWLAPRDFVQDEQWEAISERAAEAVSVARQVRGTTGGCIAE